MKIFHPKQGLLSLRNEAIANYPSERSQPAPAIHRAGRCARCHLAAEPCRWCTEVASRCPGCFLLKCNDSTIHCRTSP